MFGQVSRDSSLPGPPALAAVVLAAGASTRMGQPKALLTWRGQTFVRHVVALAEAAEAWPIVVVEGAVALPPAVLGPALKVTNPTWSNGQTDSLRRGLQALTALLPNIPSAPSDALESPSNLKSPSGSLPGVLVLTVDRPHLRPDTARALAAAFRAAPGQIWQPAHQGRRGHPILYPPGVVPDLLATGPAETARDLLARPAIAALRRAVAVDDPAVLDNLDHPADLARLP